MSKTPEVEYSMIAMLDKRFKQIMKDIHPEWEAPQNSERLNAILKLSMKLNKQRTGRP